MRRKFFGGAGVRRGFFARAATRTAIGVLACMSAAGVAAGSGSQSEVGADVGAELQGDRPPNVLIIVADDLGYSDIGTFGGEIATPNLDRLAAQGVRLTQLHSAPSCSPTRAMMMSGADNHIAGLGAMAEHIPVHYRGQQGFEGVLSTRVASLAERFEQAGYRTAMAGKWHLGMKDGQRPAQRGFQTSFALLQGAANHFGQGGFGSSENGPAGGLGGATYVENDEDWEPQPGFYSSDVIASKLIGQLSEGNPQRPFFAYLSFTAPHSPLQAPAEDIARYADRYKGGWARLTKIRLAGMAKAGVLPPDINDPSVSLVRLQQLWDSLPPADQAREARRMAIYAAMVDRMDHNIGHVLDALEAQGQLDKTVILFMSDNGPAGEYPRQYGVMPGFTERYESADQSLEAMGASSSFVLQDPRWATAISAPSRLFKGFVTEGGTHVPAILIAPERKLPLGGISPVNGDMRDVAPTLLALAGIAQADEVSGIAVAPIEGSSLLPWLAASDEEQPVVPVAFGFNGQGLVRDGEWKAMRLLAPFGDGQWHLYNLHEDPAEQHDRKADEPARFTALMDVWQAYVTRHGLNEQADLAPRIAHRETKQMEEETP